VTAKVDTLTALSDLRRAGGEPMDRRSLLSACFAGAVAPEDASFKASAFAVV
jgi:hypothetical protein